MCLEKKRNQEFDTQKGQAAVEYMLLIVVVFLVFGIVFYVIRTQIFQLWTCEISPRIQSPVPCTNRVECWNYIDQVAGSGSTDAQRDLCERIN